MVDKYINLIVASLLLILVLVVSYICMQVYGALKENKPRTQNKSQQRQSQHETKTYCGSKSCQD